ncbi:interleukin-20 receptor subunit alpha isoform X2 [Hypomesus transpacificus]|uniref:interleukin-20 receptor subunit alpha isoform X2 n=1 Tax=Hypomesus transpacificus TaxID=137520 RepID=UPI001F07966D|nr:interleukin-20 receptor subunit alpha isoform X2 [Hypomesus transpacificus]
MLQNNLICVLLFTIVQTAVSPRSSLPKPVNLTFTSLNLRNELRWSPGEKSPDHTHYSVDYAIYGDKEEGGGKRLRWRVARLCRDIAKTWCDLTNETSDLEEGYFARVKATATNTSSKWTITPRRFDPKHDTVLGPPLVSVKVQDTKAKVWLSGPMRWPVQNQTPQVPMSRIFPQMTFNLSVWHQDRNRTRHFLLSLQSLFYEYPLLEYDKEYCFSAKADFLSLPLVCLASEWHCIHTPPDPVVGQMLRVLLGVVVPSVCLFLLLLTGWMLYRSVQGKEHKSPHTLEMSHLQTPPRTFSPETVNIMIFHLLTESTMEMPVAPKPAPLFPTLPTPPGQSDTLSLPSFPGQRPPCTPAPDAFWEDEVPENRKEEVDYGLVGLTSEQDQGQNQGQYRSQDQGQGRGRGQGQAQSQGQSQSQGQGQYRSQHQGQSQGQGWGRGQGQGQSQTQSQGQSQGHYRSQHQGQSQGQGQGQSVEKLDEESISAGIHLERDLHTGLFHIPLPASPLRLERWREREGESQTLLPYAPQLGSRVLSSNAQQRQGSVWRLPPQSQEWDGNSKGEESQPLLQAKVNLSLSPAQTHSRVKQEEVKEEEGLEQEEEEEGGHCVDWSPETRKLHIPFLPFSWDKVEAEIGTENRMEGGMEIGTENRMEGGMERGIDRWIVGGIEAEGALGQIDPGEILPSVLVRQASQESEPESDITNLQNTWSLQINVD